MIDRVLETCRLAGAQRVVAVLNPAQPEVAEHVAGRCEVCFQERQRGTGDALAAAPIGELSGDVIVLNADSPLVSPSTVRRLVETHRESGAAATLATVVDPGRADGRIVRTASGIFDSIVEAKDATAAQLGLTEFNVGLYCFRAGGLAEALAALKPDNAAGELYLTDVFRTLRPIATVAVSDPEEAMGINDRVQLARAEAALRRRRLESLMRAGVTVTDPATTFVDEGVVVGEDVVLEPFTILRGTTRVGRDTVIGAHSELRDAEVGEGCRIDHSWLDGCTFGDRSECGPFAKIRPGSAIGPDVHIGSFGEIVRSRVGRGTRMGHFSYLGDAVVGEDVNIGAGAVTANYDGAAKHRTEIEDGVFVGVGTMLRAPVRLGRGSQTAAGAVVLEDVPEGALVAGVPARVRGRAVAHR